jgi:selenoprotein W-related protein
LIGELLTKYEFQLDSVTIIPSDGGRFEVTLDGELIFSKKALGRHAEPGEIAALLADKLPPPRPVETQNDHH